MTRRVRVLHVDDDPHFCDLTATVLEQEHDQITVETATNADEGLNRIKDNRPHCVVSDYNMPGQNGIEFLRSVREECPELPFILFTGKGSEQVAGEAVSAGVTDYLQKSTETEQYELLANRIMNAVDQFQTNQQLQQEQKRFRALFDRLSQPTVEVRYEAGEPIVTQVNAAFVDVFGYDPETLIGDSLDTHIVPDDRTEEATAINQHVQSGGRLKSREVIRQTADGPRKFLIQNAVYDGGSGGFAIYTDITQRSNREETLERTQELLQHTEQLAKIGGWEADVDTGEQRWTQGTYAVHDLAPGEFKPSIEAGVAFYHPEDRATIETAVENCRVHGETYDLDLRLVTADDEQKWVRTTGTPVYDGDEIVKIRGAIRDITQQREREQELLKLKQQYQTLAENFPDGAVYLIDENLKYVRARGQELANVGLSPGDIEGHTPHDLFPNTIADTTCQHIEMALDGTASVYEQEYEGSRYRNQVVPVRTDGENIAHVMLVAQNITEYAQNREKLKRQNERLEEFTSVVSHDLRNPLNAAEIQLELAQDECESAHLDATADAIDRSQTLVEDLLTLARSDDTVTNTEPVALSALTQKCWNMVPDTEAAGLIVDTTQSVVADRSRLRQLLENLFANAVEHGDEDVTVRIGDLPDGFYVADDGAGIPEQERENVFEAGYSTTSDGTGFGLRIVKQVVDAHGWTIDLTEGNDGGARFEITGADISE